MESAPQPFRSPVAIICVASILVLASDGMAAGTFFRPWTGSIAQWFRQADCLRRSLGGRRPEPAQPPPQSATAPAADRTRVSEAPPPKGRLTFIRRAGRNASEYVDEANVHWIAKPDSRYAELQSAAEAISARIYRALGYEAAEVHVVTIEGKRYAVSRVIDRPGTLDSMLDTVGTEKFRRMRIVAAYLMDFDRLASESANNINHGGGEFSLFDFGGTLGSTARGEHKPGSPFSAAVGSFEATSDVAKIYEAFDIGKLGKNHPWRLITPEDARAEAENFRRNLTDDVLRKAVEAAMYSEPTDADYVLNALRARRDAIISGLEAYLRSGSRAPRKPETQRGRGPVIAPMVQETSHNPRTKRFARSGSDDHETAGKYLDGLSDREISELLARLYRDDEDFRRHVEGTVLAGYPHVTDPFWKHNPRVVEEAVLFVFAVQKKPGLFSDGKPDTVLRNFLDGNSILSSWLEELDRGSEPSAAEILASWEAESSLRLSPRPAVKGRFLDPEYEKRIVFARIGSADYLSSPDGKSWLRVAGNPSAPAAIPRWDGDLEGFSRRMAAFREHPLTASGQTATPPSGFRWPALHEEVPTKAASSGQQMISKGRATPFSFEDSAGMAKQSVQAGAYGYHVTLEERLEGILTKGWLPDQEPTNPQESARDPGLHLSTHLGVSYPVPGKTVILRTIMNPTEYKARDFSPYFGHVVRDTPIPANSVSKLLEFSPDNGVSWYPLSWQMLFLLRANLLPRMRAIPVWDH
jgi:hypothetical protein